MWVKLSSIWEERTPLKCRVFCKLNRLLRDSQASPHKPENCLELLVRSVRSFVVQWRHLMGNEGTKWGCKEMFSLIKQIHVIRLIYLLFIIFSCVGAHWDRSLYIICERSVKGAVWWPLLLHFSHCIPLWKWGTHTGQHREQWSPCQHWTGTPWLPLTENLCCLNGEIRGQNWCPEGWPPVNLNSSHLWPYNKLTQREWG